MIELTKKCISQRDIKMLLPCDYDKNHSVTVYDYGDEDKVLIGVMWHCFGGTACADAWVPRNFESDPELYEECRQEVIREVNRAESRNEDLAFDAWLDNFDD